MPPGSAARRPADAVFGPGWVAVGRRGIEVRRVPVGAPLMDVRGDAEHPEPVRFAERDRPRTGQWAASFFGNPGRNLVSPWIPPALDAAARGALPLGLGWEPQGGPLIDGGRHAGIGLVAPAAIRLTVEPADADDREIAGDREETPVARALVAGCAQKAGVLPARDRMDR